MSEFVLPIPSWWEGASGDEVWAFQLSACTCPGRTCQDNPPDGSAIPTMSDEEIRHHLSTASRLLATHKTRWLEGYARQLVDERRRRKGVAIHVSTAGHQGRGR